MGLFIRSVFQDSFLKHNAIFFVGSIAVAVLNYLYHPVLGRLMNVADFGEVQALISLFMQVSVILLAFGLIAVNIIANGESRRDVALRLAELQTLAIYIILGLSGLLLFLSPIIKRAFKFGSVWPIFSLALLLVVTIPLTFRRSYLQGNHDFVGTVTANIIIALGRLVFAVPLLLIGLATFGAIGGLVLATICALTYVIVKTRGKLNGPWLISLRQSSALTRELRYGLLVVLTVGFVTFLSFADIIMAKYFFPPETAGLYSGISTIANIIFFTTSSFAAVLLPSIKRRNSYRHNSALLGKTIVLSVFIGGMALITFLLFPRFIVTLLIGSKYIEYAPLLPLLGLVSFLVSLVNILFYYFLALRNYLAILISPISAGLIGLLSRLNHSEPRAIAINFLVGSALTVILLGLLWYHEHGRMLLVSKHV